MRDGNGVVWRKSRLQFLDMETFWLSPRPEGPWRGNTPAWGGSPYQRSCVVCRFRDSRSGSLIGLLSAHFDHEGGDELATGGSEARRQSAALVMDRALRMKRDGKADIVIVCGDFNTFEDRAGATYSALTASADGQMVDVRDCPGVLEVDGGRGSATWEGWEDNPWRREVAGDQRYDQMFVGAEVAVRKTCVVQERYPVPWNNDYHWVYPSDHMPIVSELSIPVVGSRALLRRLAYRQSLTMRLRTARANMCMSLLCLLAVALFFIIIWLMWDLFATSIQCRIQCRNRGSDPPFDFVQAPPTCNASSA